MSVSKKKSIAIKCIDIIESPLPPGVFVFNKLIQAGAPISLKEKLSRFDVVSEICDDDIVYHGKITRMDDPKKNTFVFEWECWG